MMQDEFGKEVSSNEDNVTPEFQEALAVYFERLNSESSSEAVALSARTETGLGTQVEALLEIPRRLERRSVGADAAWQRFQKRNFSVVAETQQESLGRYVSQALDQNESAALAESGLSKSTLEAIKSDATSMEALKGYQLNDYAALARRYDVKDSAFPRMLRWLKGLGKSLTMPSLSPSAGMVFAREEETRKQGLSEAEMAEQIEKTDETEKE